MLKVFKHLNPEEWLMAGIGLVFVVVQVSGLSLAIYWVEAYIIDAASMGKGAAGVLEKIELFSNMVVFSQYAM